MRNAFIRYNCEFRV